ncbi:MAG: rhamnulose-1-phosphate aldolase [Oscillospiraceae bacterium]|nr:rhamnulose-1-phosphate aldolase [Oscillospiraceae bacterium]
MNSILQCSAVRLFCRMCDDGWQQGWHERNGGNLTYRMRPEEVELCRPFFRLDRPWTSMGVSDPRLGGEYFITTGSGKYMRNVASAPEENIGIVELDSSGGAWRTVWGLENGAVPTSEFPSHYLCHCIKAEQTGGECRVMYHAHPANIVALTFVLPLTARDFSLALWKSETECPIVFPNGVGVVEWMIPGGAEIAEATGEMMRRYDAVVWAHHGLFTSGPDFDSAFGLMHTIEKAAQIHILALSASGGKLRQTIPDEGLSAAAMAFGRRLNDDFI